MARALLSLLLAVSAHAGLAVQPLTLGVPLTPPLLAPSAPLGLVPAAAPLPGLGAPFISGAPLLDSLGRSPLPSSLPTGLLAPRATLIDVPLLPAEPRLSWAAPVIDLARLSQSAVAAGRGRSAAVLGRFFDLSGGGSPAGGGGGDDDGSPLPPRLPVGVARLEVLDVRTRDDVINAIPMGPNSSELIAELARSIRRMAPYRVFRYWDEKRGFFTGIDLSSRPDLIEQLPEQQSHEVRLIRKIQVWTKDLQVLVRETGKTPDLVAGGMVTELKSLIGDRVTLTYLLAKANKQVLEHALRHGLGPGAAAVDLTAETRVPVANVLAELNAFAAMPQGTEVPGDYDGPRLAKTQLALAKVYVFAGDELKVFVRGEEGDFRLQDPAALPFTAPILGRLVEAKDIHALQLLAARGRLREAGKGLRRLEASAPLPELHEPIRQLDEALQGLRLLGRLRRYLRRGQAAAAREVWRGFTRARAPEQAARIRPQVLELLAEAGRKRASRAKARRELEAADKALARAGVRYTVFVRGGSRVVPEEEAHAEYLKVFQAVGFAGVRSPEGRRAVDRALRGWKGALDYAAARSFGSLLARQGGPAVAVATDGSGGIMEAAARGALENGGFSVIHSLRPRRGPATLASEGLAFQYTSASSQASALKSSASAYVFFPGGFDTIEELFETLGMIQKGEAARAPVVLVGEEGYWQRTLGLDELARSGALAPEDLSLLRFAATPEQAWGMVSSSLPVSTKF